MSAPELKPCPFCRESRAAEMDAIVRGLKAIYNTDGYDDDVRSARNESRIRVYKAIAQLSEEIAKEQANGKEQ